MRRNSFLVVAVCAMGTVLMAGRCSSDEKKADTPNAALDAGGADSAGDPGKVDAGVEKDPLGETIGGPGDAPASVDDPGDMPPPGGDTMLDDPTFEPQPAPEEGADL